jgi:hypothetical protein
MVRHHISDEMKEVALSMSLQGLGDSEIRKFTGVSELVAHCTLLHTHGVLGRHEGPFGPFVTAAFCYYSTFHSSNVIC